MSRYPITRAELLDPEGVYCERMRAHWRARVAYVAELGIQGKIPVDKIASFKLGLKAAIRMLNRYDPVPREFQGGPIAIDKAVLILSEPSRNGDARAPLPADGVRLHLGHGHGANGSG